MLRPLNAVPFRLARRTLYHTRKTFFATEKPSPDIVVKDITPEEMRAMFGKQHFEPGWPASYYYKGEDVNMRRPEYENDDWEYYQTHVRGFVHSNGDMGLVVHYEINPNPRDTGEREKWTYQYAHLKEKNYSREKGIEKTEAVLKQHGKEYIVK